MTPNRPTRLAALVACVCLVITGAAHAQHQAAALSDDTLLVHRFTIAHKQSWGAISIDLAVAGWRVGHIDGPPATEAQLRAALGDVAGVEVGGRCSGWVDGPTGYPCGYAVRELDFAGAVAERYAGIATDWATPDAQRAKAAVKSRPGADAGVLISPVLEAPRFVSLRAPLRYLGDKSKTFGGKLQFEIRAVSNALVPSEFDRSSGMVTLRSRRNSLRI